MSKLQDLKKQGKVNLWLDFRRNSLLDYSGNNIEVTPNGGSFVNTSKGRGYKVNYSSSDYLSVADNTALRGLNDWIVIFGDFTLPAPAASRLLDKSDGGGAQYEIRVLDSDLIQFTDGSDSAIASFIPSGQQMIAIKQNNGSKAHFYENGAFSSEFHTETTISEDDSPLYINNWSSGSRGGIWPLTQVLILDSTVTSQDISEIYNEYMQERGAGAPKTRNYKWLNNPINNEFSQDAYWTKGTGWTIANSKATSDGSQSAESDLEQDNLLTIGSTYSLEYKIINRSAGTIKIVAGTTEGTARNADGVYTEVLKCESIAFSGLSQTSRNWRGMTTLGDDIYANTWEGDIYKQTGGTGDFNALGQTTRRWYGMTTLGSDVYACVYGGDIYKQTGGTGDFVALGQTSRNWAGMTIDGSDVYACVYGGDIYKQTGGTGDFVALGQTSRNWAGMTTLGSDVYASVYGGDIYKQTGGTGDFNALGQTSRDWVFMTTLGSDVYACVYGGDIYKQTGGTGDFVALGQTSRNWYGMTTLGSDVYACVSGGDIYKQTGVTGGAEKVIIRADSDFVGSIEYIKVHKGNKILYNAQPEYWLPTLANVTDGYLSNTDFKVNSGTWKVSQERLQNSGELTPNGDFSLWTDPTVPDGWNKSGTENANNYVEEGASGGLRLVSDGTGTGITQDFLTPNTPHKLIYDVTDATLGAGKFTFTGGEVNFDTVGHYETIIYPTASTLTIYRQNIGSACDITIDNLSIETLGSGKKWIENTSGTGITYTKQKQAFGTWVWRARKSTADTVRIWFFCEDNELTTSAGYYYYDAPSGGGARIIQQPGGSQICPASKYMDNQISYTFAFTRDFDGAIALYRKEEGENWENLGSDTHAASITANYMGFYSTGNVEHAFLGIHQGILTINELSQLYK